MPDEQRRLPALEIFVGFQITGVTLRQALNFRFADLRGQHAENLWSKLVLDREEVARRAVETFGPQLFSRLRVREMDVQPQVLVDALNGSGHDITDRWSVARHLAARSAVHGRKSDDPEPGHLRQVGQEVRCDATSQEHLLRIVAQRLERSDGNGRLRQAGCFGACHRGYALALDPPRSGRSEQQCGHARSRHPRDASLALGVQVFRIRPSRCGGDLRRPDHRGDQPVAPLRDRLDVSRVLGRIPKRLTQFDDDLGEGVVAHNHAGPHG